MVCHAGVPAGALGLVPRSALLSRALGPPVAAASAPGPGPFSECFENTSRLVSTLGFDPAGLGIFITKKPLRKEHAFCSPQATAAAAPPALDSQ